MKQNSVLRQEARNVLSGKWVMAALAAFVYTAITGAAGSIPAVGVVVTLLILPIGYGLAVLFLKVFRGEEVNIGSLFDGFQDYGRILGTALLQAVYTVLWMLLLVVPGVVKSYSYAMTNYVLLEEPELKFNAAIERSMAMMEGHKMRLFLLDLSFIGWALLSILTLGIGMFWLQPYVSTAHAAFYEDLKSNAPVAA